MARIERHYTAWQGYRDTTLHGKDYRGMEETTTLHGSDRDTTLHGNDRETLLYLARLERYSSAWQGYMHYTAWQI